jgi:hypothetical protein
MAATSRSCESRSMPHTLTWMPPTLYDLGSMSIGVGERDLASVMLVEVGGGGRGVWWLREGRNEDDGSGAGREGHDKEDRAGGGGCICLADPVGYTP